MQTKLKHRDDDKIVRLLHRDVFVSPRDVSERIIVRCLKLSAFVALWMTLFYWLWAVGLQ